MNRAVALLLDTNICIGFLNRREPELRTRLREASQDKIRLCSVVKAELLFGAHNSSRVEQNLLIAAIALSNDLTVVTRNDREFRRVPGLRVEVW